MKKKNSLYIGLFIVVILASTGISKFTHTDDGSRNVYNPAQMPVSSDGFNTSSRIAKDVVRDSGTRLSDVDNMSLGK